MNAPRSARELELAAAAEPASGRHRAPKNELTAMLLRRGFRVTFAELDLPFPPDLTEAHAERIAAALQHYAMRLFLRGAIQRADGFTPSEVTRFLSEPQAVQNALELVALGLAESLGDSRFRLLYKAHSFGGILEWYLAHELRAQLGFDTLAGVKFHAPGVGGDLDVVSLAEGRLCLFELKSSPPRHLSLSEVRAFLDRVRALRPAAAFFVVDTALRLADKVVPMFEGELRRLRPTCQAPRRVLREVWALSPHVYLLNARPDLMTNVARAVSEAWFALGPDTP